MVRVSSPAKLRPWSELTAKMVMGVVPGLAKVILQDPLRSNPKMATTYHSRGRDCKVIPQRS